MCSKIKVRTYKNNWSNMKLTITKRIAKQGKNLVLIIPKNIHSYLEQGDLVELTIQKLEDKR